MKIHHFAIEVECIDKSLEFYTEKLCFKIKTPLKYTEDGLYAYANIDLGGSELELIQLLKDNHEANKEKHFSNPALCPHIALESFDFERDLLELKKKGVKIFDGPHVFPGDVKIVTILDPDNYRIDIGQILK
jgi:catechol 2,3-dioxygenase-like lactoylglutathione lyase family enzyme